MELTTEWGVEFLKYDDIVHKPREINAVADAIKKTENLQFKKVYLFGSYAKNKQCVHSDIDLAFIFDENETIDYFDLQVQMLVMASYIDTRIEPHPMSSEDFTPENPLACEILTTGLEISLQI